MEKIHPASHASGCLSDGETLTGQRAAEAASQTWVSLSAQPAGMTPGPERPSDQRFVLTRSE